MSGYNKKGIDCIHRHFYTFVHFVHSFIGLSINNDVYMFLHFEMNIIRTLQAVQRKQVTLNK